MKNLAPLSTILPLLPTNVRALVVLLAFPIVVLPLVALAGAASDVPSWVPAVVVGVWLLLLVVGVIATVVLALRREPPS